MNFVKRLTQSVTWLEILTIALFIIPLILAQLGRTVGLWVAIDQKYLGNVTMYWILFGITRSIFGVAWALSTFKIVEIGEKHEFFWFRPDTDHYHKKEEPSRDKSWDIVLVVMLIIFDVMISEVAIRIYTGDAANWFFVPVVKS